MQTHPDIDANYESHSAEVLAQLEAKAKEMMASGESQITAGKDGEKPVQEEQVGMFLIRQMPEDPLCLRISIGESNDVSESGYFVFRGQPDDIEQLLVRALSALRASHFAW